NPRTPVLFKSPAYTSQPNARARREPTFYQERSTTMMPNRLFEELAKAIGYALSDASDAGVASEEGIRKLVAAMGAMRGLASISAPFQEAYELAEWATDELEGEIDACANCKADGLPIHWSPVDSFGLEIGRCCGS